MANSAGAITGVAGLPIAAEQNWSGFLAEESATLSDRLAELEYDGGGGR